MTLADLPPPAVVDGHRRLDSVALHRRGLEMAGLLARREVVRGDVVAFQLPNAWQTVALFHACWALGAVAAPMHHRASPAEVEGLRDRLGARVFVQDVSELDGLPGPAAPVDVRADDLAVLLATSGASGPPKIVRHTHGALAYKAHTMVDAHGLDPHDVVLMPAPLAHISGLLNGVLVPGAGRMRTVLMRRWVPAEAVELIMAEQVSFMIGPPAFFADLMAEPSCTPERVASLRLVSLGGAGVTPSFVARVADTLGVYAKRTYGSTEAPTVTTAHAGDPVGKAQATDGRPVGKAEIRLAADGQLEVRGPELFIGYDDHDANRRAFTADGWYRTGDLATIDEDGWVTIVGRLDDMIIRGGENVSPAEVEAVCATFPGVRQVAVVGYPDERLGQRVGLVVVADPAPTLEQVREHCRVVGLADFKAPERIRQVEAIPVLAAGKPDRATLARLLDEGVST